jgi:hypothetical protein
MGFKQPVHYPPQGAVPPQKAAENQGCQYNKINLDPKKN